MWRRGGGRQRGLGDQTTYQTTLSDAQYARIEPLLPRQGKPFRIPHRQVLYARLYVCYEGCTWHGLPREFGN